MSDPPAAAPLPPHVVRQLLVAFKDNKGVENRHALFQKYNFLEIQEISKPGRLFLIEIPVDGDLKKAQKDLSAEPSVRYAEPNNKVHTLEETEAE